VARVTLASERIEMMQKEEWYVVPVRLDLWDYISKPVSMNSALIL
jgi:hypothetical protein